MAGFRQLLKEWYDRIPDWLWPHLTGEPPSAPDEQRLPGAPDVPLLEAMERSLQGRLNQVNDRLHTVEAKLVAQLTLTSVLTATVTAGFAVASAMKIQKGFSSVPVWIAFVLASYLTANLLRSLWATVSGLMRRGYKEIPYGELVPRAQEDQTTYRYRILCQHLNNAQWNDWVVDQKVSELAVAHVALQNALSATAGVALMALVIGLLKLL